MTVPWEVVPKIGGGVVCDCEHFDGVCHACVTGDGTVVYPTILLNPGGHVYPINTGKTDKCRRFACDDCQCNSASNSDETKKTGPRETVLEEADRIVNGSRNASYGDPAGNHGTTAAMVTAYLRRRGYLVEGAELDAYDICWVNTLQKASRDANARGRDNLVDTAGYMRNAEIIGSDG